VREISWTEDSEAHVARHGITPAEVEEAIYSRPRLVAPGRDGTRLVFAETEAGRFLFVVVGEAMDGRDFVVTARDMTVNERRLFRKRGS
jgi:uncharacterized DUF497 family protein